MFTNGEPGCRHVLSGREALLIALGDFAFTEVPMETPEAVALCFEEFCLFAFPEVPMVLALCFEDVGIFPFFEEFGVVLRTLLAPLMLRPDLVAVGTPCDELADFGDRVAELSPDLVAGTPCDDLADFGDRVADLRTDCESSSSDTNFRLFDLRKSTPSESEESDLVVVSDDGAFGG